MCQQELSSFALNQTLNLLLEKNPTNVAISASYRKDIHKYVLNNDFKSILNQSYTGILYSQILIQNFDSLDPLPTALVLGTKICSLYKCSVSIFFSGIYHGLDVHRTYGKL